MGALACVGCASSPDRVLARPTPDGTGRVLTADRIERMNVATAWDVVRRSGMMVSAVDDRSGRPRQLHSRRGRSSVVLANSDTPLVILDGVRTADFRVLEQVPARTVLWVRYVSGIEATVSQGTNAGGGLIEVRTRSDLQ
jgi:outer membrane cobalamin receptor